jgi:hypothetical protein
MEKMHQALKLPLLYMYLMSFKKNVIALEEIWYPIPFLNEHIFLIMATFLPWNDPFVVHICTQLFVSFQQQRNIKTLLPLGMISNLNLILLSMTYMYIEIIGF